VAALALGIVVLAGGAYRFTGSRLAQVSAPTACIRSYGPFFQSTAAGDREESVSVFPDGTRFLKVTGPKTVSLFTVDGLGVVTKAVDLSGQFESAAVVALSDTLAAVAYQEDGAAYYRLIRLNGVGGPTLDEPFKLADVPVGFGPYVRFALDALNQNLFVLVTNIPEAEGPKTLRAIVGGTVTNGALRPMGSYARPPAESSQAIVDFDVAAVDIGNTNTETFVVAFRGANGAKFIRGTNNPIGVVFDDAYLANLSPTAMSLDLGSSFARPRKAALSYMDNGSAYAGEIVLATAPTDFTEDFSPTRISQNGDVVTGVGVDWIDEQLYVAAFGVRQSQSVTRKGTFIRRGFAGSSAFGSELKVTDASNPGSLALSGIPGARGRILIAQASATAADTGLVASYCAGCVDGVSDVGEQCVPPTGTPVSGGGDAPLCDPRFCGNDNADPGEQCDDGNTAFGDGCDALCRLECSGDGDCPSGECAGGVCTNLCGNGIVEPPTCVTQGGGRFDCPAPDSGEVRMVNLPGDGFATGHASGDVNGDGKLDLVVAYYIGTDAQDGTSFTGTLQAYINRGDGQFDPKKSVGTFQWNRGGGQRGMDIVDVDKDGDGDVLVYDGSAQGIVVLKNNNMTFTRSTAVPGQFAFYLSHGDANGDGDPELGVTGFPLSQGGVYGAGVYPGAAIASFGDPVNLGSSNGYDDLRFADMDNDGDEDVVRVGGSNIQPFGYGLYAHLSNGDGTFADPIRMFERGTNPNVLGMDVGDVDGDGNLDVALAENGPVVTVVRGDGEGGSLGEYSVGFPFGVRFVALVDPTADGKLDVVSGPGQGTEGRNLWIASGKGDGTFDAATRFLTVSPPASGRPPFTWNNSYYYNYDLKSADYDGDGRKDLSLVHALSSDSATVILLRGSLDGCTEVPPVVICSQAEECDDGLQNGQAGKCTRQCTLCGNGVIDTVNGVAERCDDGEENGTPLSECSLRCTLADTGSRHLACVGIGMCAIVDGEGDDQCLDGATDCTCLPSDPFCTHAACVEGSCVERPGPGMPLCSSDADCTICLASDPDCHEKCDVLGMQCVAAPTGGCPVRCEEVRHLACENEQCVIKPGAGDNECETRADCGVDLCGNGMIDDGEECDDQNLVDGDLCTNECVLTACTGPNCPRCGDGIEQPLIGEQCDDGNSVNGDACNNNCRTTCSDDGDCDGTCDEATQQCIDPVCGDGVVTESEGEQCDDGNTDDGDACTNQCVLRCSNDVFCQCDETVGICVPEDCGNGIIDAGEQCDDSNRVNGDACNNACRLNTCTGPNCPRCGDGTTQPLIGEQCDDGNTNDADACTNLCSLRCTDDSFCQCDETAGICLPGLCGNGMIDDGEECDDQNRVDDDLCNNRCVLSPCTGPNCPRCGDGTTQPLIGEQCDDGNTNDADACNNNCRTTCSDDGDCEGACDEEAQQCIDPFCGDGVVTESEGEQCDDGNREDGDACANSCLLRCSNDSFCECDETVGICVPEDCGNGIIDAGEQCDDQNTVNDDACSNICRLNACTGTDCPRCGDGTTQPLIGEQCDDGNTNDADACTNLCSLRCTDDSFCQCDETAGICQPGLCGNGTLDAGEDCDEGPNNRTGAPDDLSSWYCKAPLCTRSECFDGGDNDHDNLPDVLDAGCWLYDVKSTRANRSISFLGFLLAQTAEPLEELDPKQFLAGKDNESCPAETVDRGSFCALTCEAGDVCPGGEACPADGVCPVLCPNGAIDDNEQCDDGNLEDGDLCNNICRLNECTGPNCPRCGDGVFQHQIGEQCDDGNQEDGDACTNNCRMRCDGNDDCQGLCDLVTQQCLPAACGDGETNQAWERCDDGNIVNDDQCNNQCQPTCKGDADCESGKCDQPRQVCVPLCGNGTVDSQEQCDDGNMIDKDQCSNQCLLHCSDDSTCDCDEEAGVCRPLCGNGRIDIGEGCDDGNTDNADACSNRCQVRCRPGTVCPDNQACPQNGLCPVPGQCGDGIVNDASEQCDDGNKVDGDGCSNACTIRCEQNLECPSGLLCIGRECSECTNSLQCSDGFCVEGRCRQALPICGNGVVEPGEVCDDANGDDADGCTSSCLFPRDHACVASAQCQTKLCEGQVCTPCTSAGQCGSGLRCAEGNCLFGGEQCGDGAVQAGEACDDANVNDQDQCTSACLLPFGRACTHATQCASTICSAGSCTPCRGDSECSGGLRCAIGLCLTDRQMSLIPNICGNGYVEEGETCDDGNGAYGDGCTPSCQVGNSPGRSEVAANVNVQLPFSPMANVGEVAGGSLHAGASGGLSDTGPATVAVMAAGAAAGTAWVRRKFGKKKR
jgi:cysteine-rich repeat protein